MLMKTCALFWTLFSEKLKNFYAPDASKCDDGYEFQVFMTTNTGHDHIHKVEIRA